MQFASEDEFRRQHRRFMAQARENFLKDHVLQGVLALYGSGRDEPVMFVRVHEQTSAEEQRTMMVSSGVLPVPGAFRDFQDRMGAVAVEVGAFGATLLTESWYLKDEYAQESLRTGVPPSEHPMRDEVLSYVSIYPGRGWRFFGADRIVRSKTGADVRLECNREGDIFGSTFDEGQLAGWIVDILPGPLV